MVEFFLPADHPHSIVHALDKTHQEEGLPYALAEVNCHNMHKLCDQLSLTTFPTLAFMVKGDPIVYHGQHSAHDVHLWITELIHEDLSVISSD